MRASPAWANDCVEAFLAAPGAPRRYLEIVLDAGGGLYAARVSNPDESRATWRVDVHEPPPGLRARVAGEGAPEERTRWTGALAIPWSAVGVAPVPDARLLGNFFRIARGASVHHLALSSTHRDAPPEFHVPSRFAELVLSVDAPRGGR